MGLTGTTVVAFASAIAAWQTVIAPSSIDSAAFASVVAFAFATSAVTTNAQGAIATASHPFGPSASDLEFVADQPSAIRSFHFVHPFAAASSIVVLPRQLVPIFVVPRRSYF